MLVSAVTGEGVPELLATIERTLSGARPTVTVELGADQLGAAPWLYENTEVLERSDDPETGRARLKVRDRREAPRAVPRMGAARARRGRGVGDAQERLRLSRVGSRCLRLDPKRFHLVERRLAERAAAALAAPSRCGRSAGRTWRWRARSAVSGSTDRCRREIGDGEEDVAELVLEAILVVRRLGKLLLDLGDLLADLRDHRVRIVPVEADLAGALLQLHGARQRGEGDRHVVEQAAGIGRRPFSAAARGALGLLLRLDRIPARLHRGGVAARRRRRKHADGGGSALS